MPLTSLSVNEIFDPDRVDGIYNKNPSESSAAIALDRCTNYGVVCLELLEHLYEKLYMQRLQNPNETQWRYRILHNSSIISVKQSTDSKVLLKIGLPEKKEAEEDRHDEEDLEVDYIFAATGYRRDVHEDMLS
jgi:L-ornithine N5-oxygenase